MKRLLASGMDAIYQIGPVFRRGDRGRHHNIEFSMLEWYKTGDDYQAGINRLADLVRFVAESVSFRSEVSTSRIPHIESKSYRRVFEAQTGVNPHDASSNVLRQIADIHHIAYPESFTVRKNASIDDETEPWLDLLFSELVQPTLGETIVFDFPASQSQLARTRVVHENKNDIDNTGQNAYEVTERFELFLDGIEIANGYHELLDDGELRRRFGTTARQRAEDGRATLPIESRLLAAMQSGLPASAGCALGLERLLMFLLAADNIDQILAFPIETA